MGQHIGAKFNELGEVLRAVDSDRLGICLDTQHAFAAGYDLTNPEACRRHDRRVRPGHRAGPLDGGARQRFQAAVRVRG